MQEWFAQWQSLLTTIIIPGVSLSIVIWNSIWVRKVRRQDQKEALEDKMTKRLDKLDAKILDLVSDVGKIIGRLDEQSRNMK